MLTVAAEATPAVRRTPMNPEVDAYVERSTRWPEEVRRLRGVLLGTGLTEELKWGKPCYAHQGGNIAIVQEMKDFLALMFFKGALLDDPDGVLEDQGPNSRSARRVQFTSVDDVERLAPAVTALVARAVAVEDAGLTVAPPDEVELADEMARRLDGDAALRAAFEALTPGRRREYHLYVSAAKKPATRDARVDSCVPRILAGKGLRDR
jgi:uncharacterized protein YdeI (YjbR/CyaY-like superfamily)